MLCLKKKIEELTLLSNNEDDLRRRVEGGGWREPSQGARHGHPSPHDLGDPISRLCPHPASEEGSAAILRKRTSNPKETRAASGGTRLPNAEASWREVQGPFPAPIPKFPAGRGPNVMSPNPTGHTGKLSPGEAK